MSENYSMEVEEEDGIEELKEEKTKTPKVKTKTRKKLDEGISLPSKKRLKGIMLSATKPSYTLKRGIGKSRSDFENLRWDNRSRLRYLLRQLVRQHNWDEASGVLSVLLKGTCNEKSITMNRTKYWATMELLKHTKGDSINPRKIQHVYELWMKKIGPMKNWPMKDKFVVQLEFILFCLTRGNLEDAHQAVIGLMQEREFGSDPTSNLVVGLTFCQLWYSEIRKKLSLGDLDESLTPLKSENFESRFFDQSIANSEEHDAVQDANSPIQCDSNTSVRNDKENVVEDFLGQQKEEPMEAYYDIKCETPHQNVETQGFYAISSRSNESKESSFISHAGDIPNASIFHARGLEPWLLPLNFPHSNENLEDFIYLQRQVHNDYYVRAVKHLRLALYSMPPILEALLPLIQMLLLGDQVKEALDELEKVIHNSEITLPLRVKARLLEHFYCNNFANLSSCFEDILKKDPTCTHSLSRLISMHRNGSYSSENLLEMIALHLDATNGNRNIWKEFASCFLKITQCEEDRMSECMNGDNDGGEKEKPSSHSNIRIPEILIYGGSGKNWRFRCRWWLTRHFSPNILASDIGTGDLELLTYKAASASHLYGRESEFVVKACSCLVNAKNRDMLSLLQLHMHNSVGIYPVFEKQR